MKLTESQLKKTIKEAVKKVLSEEEMRRVTDGSEKTRKGDMDVAAFYVNRDIKKLTETLDKLGHAYLDRYEQTFNELYDTFGSKILAISEDLEHFMEKQGYDSAMRKKGDQMF
jgi:hypothetical protein